MGKRILTDSVHEQNCCSNDARNLSFYQVIRKTAGCRIDKTGGSCPRKHFRPFFDVLLKRRLETGFKPVSNAAIDSLRACALGSVKVSVVAMATYFVTLTGCRGSSDILTIWAIVEGLL